MIFTINSLLKGDQQVTNYYQSAKRYWEKILSEEGYTDILKLSKRLHMEQFWFEQNCGGRTLGQEIMSITAIAQFYDIQVGFDHTFKKAQFVYQAIVRSYCSLEVKYYAKDAAKEYGLLEGGKNEF